MENIVRRNKVVGILLILLLAMALLGKVNVLKLHAESDNLEAGVITDYNSDYFDSYDEAIEGNAAYFLSDNNGSLYEDASGQDSETVVYATVDEAGAYLRQCMVERRDNVQFILGDAESYTGATGFAAIKAVTFAETDKPYEGDYLYWNYAGLEGTFDTVDEGILYTLYPTYLSTAEEEKQIDEKVASLMANEFSGWQNMSEFEIIKMVYTWITDTYTFVGGSDRHSTYSGLIEYETVCQGFATSEYRLLREMGISCRVVANDSHGWNIVKIGDYYYNIDATWDVGLREQSWSNFLLANESFEQGSMHTRGARFATDEFNEAYPMSDTNYVWTPKELSVGVEYRTHIQTIGWQSWVSNGATSGTEGQSKRLEGINLHLVNDDELDIAVEYMSYIQSYGWESDWRTSDTLSGTEGRAKRLEAIKIRLTGEDAELFDIYYRVHIQSFGWLGWAKNGENAGSSGLSKRLEGIQIIVLPKGETPEGMIGYSYIAYGKNALSDENVNPKVVYSTHIQSYGWQNAISDGSISGTFGEAKRLEGIKIALGDTGYEGGIQYRTHIQTYGWEQDWTYDGATSGTEGQAKRLEAIQIKLYGEIAEHYDVYYRVHSQTYGWMDWVKNGETAGTVGEGKRLEAIQIVLVPR